MKNQIIPLGENNRKVFGFTDEQIILSSKEHKTFDSLLESTKNSGLLETVKTIPLKSVKELNFNDKNQTFTIRYEKDGKIKKDSVQLDDKSIRKSLVSEIAKINDLNMTVSSESKIKPLLLNLLGVVVISIFTWIFRGMAIDAQNGEHYVASGRRSGLKQLLANVVEALGPTGVTIIGILGLSYMLYITYKRYNNPASVITYRQK
jgi:hypothetical protein